MKRTIWTCSCLRIHTLATFRCPWCHEEQGDDIPTPLPSCPECLDIRPTSCDCKATPYTPPPNFDSTSEPTS